jgi:hypothetical protein
MNRAPPAHKQVSTPSPGTIASEIVKPIVETEKTGVPAVPTGLNLSDRNSPVRFQRHANLRETFKAWGFVPPSTQRRAAP